MALFVSLNIPTLIYTRVAIVDNGPSDKRGSTRSGGEVLDPSSCRDVDEFDAIEESARVRLGHDGK
jgi:hypothetical protein